jgi:hypothetical protein
VNLVNRIVVTLLLLALIAGAVAVVVLAWAMPEDSIAGLRDAVDWLEENNEDLQKALLTTIASLVALLAFTALVFEFVPSSGPGVKVTDVQAGEAILTTAAIGQRIEEEVRGVANVSDVRAAVKPKRKGVELALELHVDPHANLAQVTNESLAAARRVLNDRLHVALLDPPRVRLHYRELRLQRPDMRPDAAPPPAPPPPAEVTSSPGPAVAAPDGSGDPRPDSG